MEEISALISELKRLKVFPTIVFVTAYNNFAIDAIKQSAFDYLVKPIDFDDLKNTILRFRTEKRCNPFEEKIDNLLSFIKQEKLSFKTKTGGIFINPQEIVYCQADGNYVDIFIDENRTLQKKDSNNESWFSLRTASGLLFKN